MIAENKIVESDYVYAEAGSAWVQVKTDPVLRTLFNNYKKPEPAALKLASYVRHLDRYSTFKIRSTLTTLLLGIIVLLAVLLMRLVLTPIPTTSDLDADLEQVRNEIKRASDESAKYSTSAIKALIELRKETLQNTEAMLSQKRASILRRINIVYTRDGSELAPTSETKLNEIKQDIDQADRKLTQSKKNAEQYTGGLVQAMSLMTVETDRFSVAQLQLKYYAAKYGLPFYFPEGDAASKQPPPLPGNVVKDREAL